MKNQFWVIFPLVTMLSVSACTLTERLSPGESQETIAVETIPPADIINDGLVADALIAFLNGGLEPSDLLITYSDLHPLHGGLEMTIDGLGHVQQQALREEVLEPEDLDEGEMAQLVTLLVELEAWKQTVPERTPLPDESRAVLLIQAGDSDSQMWEWYNDMVGNDRLIRIRETMKQFAWE